MSQPFQTLLLHVFGSDTPSKEHSGPPIDAYWLMAGYFDAFLFALSTVWDMSDKPVRDELDKSRVFRFVKALINILSHHSILVVGVQGNEFSRPFLRKVMVSAGGNKKGSSRLLFNLYVLRKILDTVELERSHEKRNIDISREFITELEARDGHMYLEDIMGEAVHSVSTALPDT